MNMKKKKILEEISDIRIKIRIKLDKMGGIIKRITTNLLLTDMLNMTTMDKKHKQTMSN